MSWDGYFRFGDNEIINRPRTLAYARAKSLWWVKDPNDNPYLGPLLGQSYTSPETDLPPWVDPDEPHSYDFCGLLPIEVSGLEDSTRQSEVFEYTTDGGNPGRLRHHSKAVVFSVALIGVSDAACEYGFRWLKRALLKADCSPQSGGGACRGQNLTYVRSEPYLDNVDVVDGGNPLTAGAGSYSGGTPSAAGAGSLDGGAPSLGGNEQWWQFERHLREVLINSGPKVTSKRSLKTCAGAVWSVTFTATAGDPFEYGTPRGVLRALGDGTDPYMPGVTGAFGSTTYDEAQCPKPVYSPIFDPTCSALTPPPPPPDIMAGCFEIDPGDWDRQYAVIPDSMIPLWDEARPVITIRTPDAEARMVRLRFYEAAGDPGAECGAVGEFVISYIPANHTLIIDTVAQAVYAYSGDGVLRRADSLVYGDGDAKPISWFGLSCGDTYTVTLDRPVTGLDAVEVDLDLAPRSA